MLKKTQTWNKHKSENLLHLLAECHSFWNCGGTLALAKVSSVNRKHSHVCHIGYSSISCVSSSEKSLSELSLDEFRLSCSRSAASVAYFCTYSAQQKQLLFLVTAKLQAWRLSDWGYKPRPPRFNSRQDLYEPPIWNSTVLQKLSPCRSANPSPLNGRPNNIFWMHFFLRQKLVV